jgi:2-dehydro-3-deoxygluconokinase
MELVVPKGYALTVMPQDVSAIGPLNIDLLITGDGPTSWEAISTWDGPADMEMAAAGSVGYTVQNLARLGLSVRISSCLPDDPLGGFILDTLHRTGVDTDLVKTVTGTDGGIGVYMLLFGSRKRPLAYRLPTHELWPVKFSPQEVDVILDARLLHNGGYLHHQAAWHGELLNLFKQAKQRGLRTSMDPQFPLYAMDPPWLRALNDVLPYVDLLFCDETEAEKLTTHSDFGRAAQLLLDAGVQTVIIKQGKQGSTIYRTGWQHHQDAIVVGELVDSIGAGDAFDAGVIYGWLHDWPWEQSVLFASVAAGYTVTGVGGTQNMPGLEILLHETQKRLEQNDPPQ